MIKLAPLTEIRVTRPLRLNEEADKLVKEEEIMLKLVAKFVSNRESDGISDAREILEEYGNNLYNFIFELGLFLDEIDYKNKKHTNINEIKNWISQFKGISNDDPEFQQEVDGILKFFR